MFFSLSILLLSCFVQAQPASVDARVCDGGNANNTLPPSYFTLNETDNPYLSTLSKIFSRAGNKVTVADVLASANRDLQEGIRVYPVSEMWIWNNEDEASDEWIPQGMTSSGDAVANGIYEDRDIWLVSWYQNGGPNVRISFVDRRTHKYRHVLLVEPNSVDDFNSVPIHAGGIAWYGNALYVVDTDDGLRVFDMDNIWRVETGDGIGKKAESNGGGYSAANFAYVLPQMRVYNWTDLQRDSMFRHSWVALDRLDAPDTLLVGEYQQTDSSPIRVVKYPLDNETRRLRKTNSTVVTAVWAYCIDILRLQGGFSRNDTFFFARSNGDNLGDLFTWTPGEWADGVSYFPPGPEDLSYNEARKEWYTVTEHKNERYILAYQRDIN